MFELVFAWTVFTLVLGKGAEAVTHAWKGTVPPGHQARMARIRAREAKDARRGVEPPSGFERWARTVWADSWNAATERHAERWPTKAAKKAEYARARWSAWDEMEEDLGRRWEKRRAAREGGAPNKTPGDETAAPDSEPAERRRAERGPVYDGSPPTTRGLTALQRLSEANLEAKRREAREEKAVRDTPRTPPAAARPRDLTDAEWKGLTATERRILTQTDPLIANDEAGERGRILGTIQRRRDEARRSAPKKAPEGPSPELPDTPDATPKTAGEGPDEGVRDTRTPGHPPVSGGGDVIPFPGTMTDSSKGAPVAEVMNLAGATRFTRRLLKSYNESLTMLEGIVAWLETQQMHHSFAPERGQGLHARFSEVTKATADFVAQTETALKACEEQIAVRDVLEAAGADALSKEALNPRP